MKNIIKTALTVGLAIIGTGLILNEAGKGTFGRFAKGIAQNVTAGYGV